MFKLVKVGLLLLAAQRILSDTLGYLFMEAIYYVILNMHMILRWFKMIFKNRILKIVIVSQWRIQSCITFKNHTQKATLSTWYIVSKYFLFVWSSFYLIFHKWFFRKVKKHPRKKLSMSFCQCGKNFMEVKDGKVLPDLSLCRIISLLQYMFFLKLYKGSQSWGFGE